MIYQKLFKYTTYKYYQVIDCDMEYQLQLLKSHVTVKTSSNQYLLLLKVKSFKMNVTFSNNFEHILDLENHLKIVYGILFIIFQLLSITCYSGFIYFEHYGGDPMKRSIKNKLISQGFLVLMMAIVVNNSGIAWRIIIGPLYPKISVIVIFVRQFSTFIIVVCITEIVLFKVFMLYGWTYFCFYQKPF